MTGSAPDPKDRVDPASWMARALLYVEDTADVDTVHPLAEGYSYGQICATCPQLRGDPAADWRPCTIFYNRLVPIGGWCTVWSLSTPE